MLVVDVEVIVVMVMLVTNHVVITVVVAVVFVVAVFVLVIVLLGFAVCSVSSFSLSHTSKNVIRDYERLQVAEENQYLETIVPSTTLFITYYQKTFLRLIPGLHGQKPLSYCPNYDKVRRLKLLNSDVSFTSVVALLVVSGADSLDNVKLVFPPVVRVGDEATLLCLYDLEGEPLYSVKWYRGNHEFYRYMPKESPPGRVFPFKGIMVDVREGSAARYKLSYQLLFKLLHEAV